MVSASEEWNISVLSGCNMTMEQHMLKDFPHSSFYKGGFMGRAGTTSLKGHPTNWAIIALNHVLMASSDVPATSGATGL